jgi:hypothetical protein
VTAWSSSQGDEDRHRQPHGAGLGTAWGRQLAEQMLAAAGFASVEVHGAPGDPGNAVYVTTRPRP